MSEALEQFIENSGSFKRDYELNKINWFQVGGKADLVFKPKSPEELQEFLKLKGDMEVLVLGVGSNIIIRDGGYRGCVIRLGRAFTECTQLSDTEIEVGAANLDLNIALYTAKLGISGLEFLSGIPGTIGGAVKMNAGAYGGEFKDVAVKICGYDFSGNYREYSLAEMNYGYRKSNPERELIYTKVILKGKKGNPEEISKAIKEIQQKREESQPLRTKTGGSTFKNPDGHSAWKLVDEAGCRGLVVGDAIMSEKHCNFMINRGNATASDLENLGNLVRQKVKEKTGVDLVWEIKIIGEKKE